MDTLLQGLRSALQILGEHPGLTLAAVMSLGMGLEAGAVRQPPAPRHDRQVAPHTTSSAVRRHPISTWMDYIDFRRGSGDVLSRIGCDAASFNPRAVADTRIVEARHP